MVFLHMLSNISGLSRMLIEWGIRLCVAMLAAALITLVWADATQAEVVLLYYYAQELTMLALIPLSAGLIGAALLEDILHHTGR